MLGIKIIENTYGDFIFEIKFPAIHWSYIIVVKTKTVYKSKIDNCLGIDVLSQDIFDMSLQQELINHLIPSP